jgi:menaquinone-9 beta-reductase
VSKYQVGIIGGGLAGLCAALHLKKLGYSVILWEKGEYPRHKVCGEYVSNETLEYLKFLGYDPFDYGAVKITELKVTHWDGSATSTPLEQGAFGISRFLFDFHLYELCIKNGVDARLAENVTGYEKLDKGFQVKTSKGKTTEVEILVSAHGKKSNMDRIMDREFFQKDADFIGVKYHFNYKIPSHLVSLNNFETGYCGVSMIENEKVNVCYLSTKTALKKYGSIEGLEEALVKKNPFLNDVFKNGEKLFEEPKTISENH